MFKMSAAMCIFLSALSMASAHYSDTATETHMFSLPISPNMFNWTYQLFDQQYRFHASLEGKPQLPSWLQYIYSGRHHAGFIFGTPPRDTKSPIMLEVIGLNRQDYETRSIQIKLTIKPKKEEEIASHQLQLKIDNLNVEDLLDQHRMDLLTEIFTAKLWPGTERSIYPTFLASAVDMGARLPLRPNEGEGLVVRLGSRHPFSDALVRLRAEVQPLSRLGSCPREYKRSSVERLFRGTGFTLDWCAFRMYEVKYAKGSTELREILDEPETTTSTEQPDNEYEVLRYAGLRRDSITPRSYFREMLAAIVVPLLLMLLPVSALTVSLCCHYVGVAQKTGKVEMCRYERPKTDTSKPEASPNSSLVRPYSPKSSTNLAGNYNRPQPPPYLGSNTNILRNQSPSPNQSPEHNRTLEESLKLLNEAKIGTENDYNALDALRKSKSGVDIENSGLMGLNGGFLERANTMNPDLLKKSTSTMEKMRKNLTLEGMNSQIIDHNDGMEDYVAIQTDGYMSMKPNLSFVTIKSEAFGNGDQPNI